MMRWVRKRKKGFTPSSPLLLSTPWLRLLLAVPLLLAPSSAILLLLGGALLPLALLPAFPQLLLPFSSELLLPSPTGAPFSPLLSLPLLLLPIVVLAPLLALLLLPLRVPLLMLALVPALLQLRVCLGLRRQHQQGSSQQQDGQTEPKTSDCHFLWHVLTLVFFFCWWWREMIEQGSCINRGRRRCVLWVEGMRTWRLPRWACNETRVLLMWRVVGLRGCSILRVLISAGGLYGGTCGCLSRLCTLRVINRTKKREMWRVLKMHALRSEWRQHRLAASSEVHGEDIRVL